MNPAECAELFGDAASRAISLHPVLEDFEKHMVTSIEMNFRAMGRPNKWTPSKKNPGHTLIDKGDLFASSNVIVEGDTDLLLVAGGMGQPPAKAPSLQYGARIPYKHKGGRFVPMSTRLRKSNLSRWGFGEGKFAGGATRGDAILPPRPYLLFQEDDLRVFHGMATAYIFETRLAAEAGATL